MSRNRGVQIWVSPPSGQELKEMQAARETELSRPVSMAEVVEQVLAERRALLLAKAGAS